MSKADAYEQLHEQVKTAHKAAAENPLWDKDLDELEVMVRDHELGTCASGWENPYPTGDPRSLLLEYQFVPFHDKSRFKFQLQARQSGKDFTAEGEAVTDCMSRKTEWMIGAPSERQALDSLDQAKLWAEAYELHIEDYEEKREGSSSATLLKSAEITYSTGSRQRAVPGKPDTVRGRSANVLLTEFDFFENPEATWKAILPSITNPLRGGDKMVRLVTTPNGKGGAGHKIWTKPDGKKMKWSKHLITIYHAVLMGLPVDPEVIREAMDDDDAFAQELLCRFLDGSNVLLPYELIAMAESFDATEVWSLDDARHAGNTYLGIDFGRTNDPTVCWTLQRVGDILWTREVLVLRNMNSADQKQILTDRIAAANRACFDYTGPGVGLGDELVKIHKEWKPDGHHFGKLELLTFTAKLKRSLFPNLRRAFEAPTKLRIPVSTEIREDLHEMQQVISNGEYDYWAPRTKAGHSDRCTALALAVRAAGDDSGGPVEYEAVNGVFRPQGYNSDVGIGGGRGRTIYGG